MEKISIEKQLLRKVNIQTDKFPWGRLEWFARKGLNGADMTLGTCYINPGMENTMHSHPNCDEVLYVLKGSIIHRLNGEEVKMNEGDSLFIPKNAAHNAINTGTDDAVLSIAFDTGDRQTETK